MNVHKSATVSNNFDFFSFQSFSTSTENLKSAQTEKNSGWLRASSVFLSRQRLGGAFEKD